MCFGRRALVDNVKAISWYGTGDGIMVGPDSVVRDSYGECSNGRLGHLATLTANRCCQQSAPTTTP